MGDGIRNIVFADNIYYKFPPQKFKTVLCIADGKLELSALLKSKGYQIIVYEPHLRKSISKSFKNEVKIFQKLFDRNADHKVDLVVGMHPDEATVEILMYAKLHCISFAVVPCCIVGDIRYVATCNGFKDWIRRLMNINSDTQKEVLGFNGKNVMIWKNMRGRQNET